ncbi:MAG: hypothetical protein D3917_03575 [Candidatus Electrothrix sp. AX5]|nr:hypothetical protein [Candidatus Electrothrix sp. AX5]
MTSRLIGIRENGALDCVRFLLQQGIAVRIRVSGRSMLPLLQGDELIEIVPVHKKRIKIGDILLFCDKQGNPLVHRLHKRRYENNVLVVQTKGDACPGFDTPVPADQVLGSVQCIFDERQNINLHHSFERLKSRLIVFYTFTLFLLRRVIIFFKIY